jgi:hypothetical protein
MSMDQNNKSVLPSSPKGKTGWPWEKEPPALTIKKSTSEPFDETNEKQV